MSIEDSLAVLHPTAPAFSPDGARIAFAVEEAFSRRDEGVHSRIWIAAADGSGAREATRGPWSDTAPCWSPDGTSLAFLSDRGHHYPSQLSGGEQQRVPLRAHSRTIRPSSSPMSRRAISTRRQGN